MTGPHGGIIGAKPEAIIRRVKRGLPAKMEPHEDRGQFNGVVFEFDDISNRFSKLSPSTTWYMSETIKLKIGDKFNRTNNCKIIIKLTIRIMVRKKLFPIHPGEILREELLIPLNISPEELAQAIKVPKEQVK
ncbi:5541_t:CDS:2 [Funneliformis geosporum]|uniref:5541_t:CDS:1 n=1 Tax=Funneliformis geosporum TaxID=1117311 RepID=A0A9W4WL26_9GLOM|nr:5541_t:CDS:2 [Funneliformis geosporum]